MEPELCKTMPYSIRYTMSREEMNEINDKVEDVDLINLINNPLLKVKLAKQLNFKS